MNFKIYKTLTDKEKLFADLLLELIRAAKPLGYDEDVRVPTETQDGQDETSQGC